MRKGGAIPVAVRRWLDEVRDFSPNAKIHLTSLVLYEIGFWLSQLFLNFFILSQGHDREFLGMLTAIPSTVALVFTILVGLVADRMGRKRAMLLGTLGAALTMLGFVLSATCGRMLAYFIVNGFLGTFLWVSIDPFLMENSTESERVTLFSVKFAVMMGTGFIANIVGGRLPAFYAGLLGVGAESTPAYRATMLSSVAISFAAVVPLLFIRAQPRPRDRASGSILGEFLHEWHELLDLLPTASRLVLPNLIIPLGAGMLIPYLNVYFKDTFGLADATIGSLFAWQSVMTASATLLAPVLARKWGRIRSLVATEALSVPMLFLLGFVPILPVAVVAYWLRAALMNMGNPLYSSFAMEQVSGDKRATLSALMTMGFNVGWSVGTYLSGVVQENWGFRPLFVATIVFYVIAIALTWAFFGRSEPRPGQAGIAS